MPSSILAGNMIDMIDLTVQNVPVLRQRLDEAAHVAHVQLPAVRRPVPCRRVLGRELLHLWNGAQVP